MCVYRNLFGHLVGHITDDLNPTWQRNGGLLRDGNNYHRTGQIDRKK